MARGGQRQEGNRDICNSVNYSIKQENCDAVFTMCLKALKSMCFKKKTQTKELYIKYSFFNDLLKTRLNHGSRLVSCDCLFYIFALKLDNEFGRSSVVHWP